MVIGIEIDHCKGHENMALFQLLMMFIQPHCPAPFCSPTLHINPMLYASSLFDVI